MAETSKEDHPNHKDLTTNGSDSKSSPKKRPPTGQLSNNPSKKLRLELPKPSNERDGAKSKNKFIYGNYNRYYGYRCVNKVEDVRLAALNLYEELFTGKHILDIGCNDGSLTIGIAKRFPINFIVGIDIDASLIAKARKNVEHETQAILNNNDKNFIAQEKFPTNIAFKQNNYVLNNDSLLDLEEPRYDTILCFSVTKWIHLNFGDDGLKRAFNRMYRQLNENGTLILEAQDWKSYKRRKNLTPKINAHYKRIQLFPKSFQAYLMSHEVGFESSYRICLPTDHSADGFKRPIMVYKKGKLPKQTSTERTSSDVEVLWLKDLDFLKCKSS